MKKRSIKEKISLIITVIFVLTALAFNIKNFRKDIKYITSSEVNNKYNNKQNNYKEKSYNIKEHISDIWDTLGECIDYLKINIDNKEKAIEMETLIDDSITALNSIENALSKNYKDTHSNLVLYTRDIKKKFVYLKEILEKDENYNTVKEEILKSIEQNYLEGKKYIK
ncbi:hypothetical protein EXM98_14240 [Clostridium botulinum]|uniref:hypothetical protein n=1 Tax=Clostridium botulinum TaxID=1491 RepID=UPI0007E141ED|nr:hypothetical protein [Clostridium botulinum]KEI87981.1 hypothetical protein N492_13765 [Clostridium botulinum B2 267]MBY6800454.1 hypothetical protein [Clostridium botulinum]MBY6997825.1 hypothetical protein [Clostridium botulinum]MBY7010082.1 hypothetical protein [Clostridium botulinum]MCR1154621.1 hypothetical protein [Clostridium botulinum]